MKIKEKNKLIPKLRFPEFKGSGEWEIYYGNELFDNISNKKHNSDLPVLAITQDKGAIPRDMIDYTVIASKQSIKNYKVVEIGDFIISLRSFQGGIEYSNYQGICSPAYIILRKKVELENLFFKYYFKTPLYIRLLNKNLEGIRDGKMVSYKQFSEVKLPFPSLPEQQKIADFLSHLDELIEAHRQKLKRLKQHKKGLMQNLFPQEGGKVPKLRFPEFKDSGEWVEKKLGDYIEERNEISNKNYSLYSLTIDGGIIPKSDRYERSFLVKNEKEAYKKVYPNDFAYNPMNLRFGAISQYRGKEVIAVSKYYNIFNCKESMDSNFCDFYFKSNPMIILYNNIATGSLIEKRRVHFTEFLKIKIPFPPLPEQQKIASCLSSIDEIITAEAERIEQMEKHKKGLMQNLFPQEINSITNYE